MLVRNITGGPVTYTFVSPSLVLAAGQTAEIDDSLIENADFQVAQANGTIAVIQYLDDPVNYNFSVQVNSSPNEPTNDQKGALVGANSPSITNPFMVRSDVDFKDYDISFNGSSSYRRSNKQVIS